MTSTVMVGEGYSIMAGVSVDDNNDGWGCTTQSCGTVEENRQDRESSADEEW